MNDLISRQSAIDALEWTWAGKAAFDAIFTTQKQAVLRGRKKNENQRLT